MLAALHHAAEAGHTEVVGMLVIAGTNVTRADSRGYTAAHLAASQGHVEAFEKLLMAGIKATQPPSPSHKLQNIGVILNAYALVSKTFISGITIS